MIRSPTKKTKNSDETISLHAGKTERLKLLGFIYQCLMHLFTLGIISSVQMHRLSID